MTTAPPPHQPWAAPPWAAPDEARRGPRRSLASRILPWVLAAVPALSFGLAAWLPGVWAATQRRGAARVALYAVAAACAVMWVAGMVMLSSAPVDETGTPVGLGSDIGLGLMILSIVVGTTTAIAQRNAGVRERDRDVDPDDVWDHAAVERTLAARNARDHFRHLAAEDPALGREMALGRPDLQRTYDDGGLLDLNTLSAAALQRYARLTPAQAQEVVTIRERLGRLSSVDELVVHGSLDPATAARLREYAVFVGP